MSPSVLQISLFSSVKDTHLLQRDVLRATWMVHGKASKHFFSFRKHMCMVSEWGRGRILSRCHAPRRVYHGTQCHDPEIMTWAQIRSWMLTWLSYPGVPHGKACKRLLRASCMRSCNEDQREEIHIKKETQILSCKCCFASLPCDWFRWASNVKRRVCFMKMYIPWRPLPNPYAHEEGRWGQEVLWRSVQSPPGFLAWLLPCSLTLLLTA